MDQLTGPGGGGPQGADVGSTALHLAAGAGHLPVVKMLVSPTKTEDLSQIVENFSNTLLCFSYVLTQRQEQYILHDSDSKHTPHHQSYPILVSQLSNAVTLSFLAAMKSYISTQPPLLCLLQAFLID